MNKEQEYNQILDGLLIAVDMSDDVSRNMAYQACLTYAKKELDDDPQVNQFIALAAERLRQVRVHFGVIKRIVSMPEDARLHLRYAPQGGPVLTGNADGLRYLSDLCASLADTPLPNGEGPEEHVHLYSGEPPMFGDSYPLTVYQSADTWFDEYASASEDAETEASEPPPPREIMPEQIAAIEFFEADNIPLPPLLYLRYDKLYRVLSHRPHRPEDKVWVKQPSTKEDERVYVFTIRDDAQEIFEIALHLDDETIHYFTKDDLEQIWEAGRL